MRGRESENARKNESLVRGKKAKVGEGDEDFLVDEISQGKRGGNSFEMLTLLMCSADTRLLHDNSMQICSFWNYFILRYLHWENG